jgi:hypothetical protein
MKKVQGIAINTKAADVRRSDELNDDRWVNETLFLLPDVMNMVALTNMTASISGWRHVDNYAKPVIQYSYSATWDAMNQKFSLEDGDTVVSVQVNILEATIYPRACMPGLLSTWY